MTGVTIAGKPNGVVAKPIEDPESTATAQPPGAGVGVGNGAGDTHAGVAGAGDGMVG